MMEKFWRALAGTGCVVVILVIGRVIVTVGRARYWHQDWLPKVQQDPWVYVGFAAAALAIIAWAMLPGKKKKPEPPEEA